MVSLEAIRRPPRVRQLFALLSAVFMDDNGAVFTNNVVQTVVAYDVVAKIPAVVVCVDERLEAPALGVGSQSVPVRLKVFQKDRHSVAVFSDTVIGD